MRPTTLPVAPGSRYGHWLAVECDGPTVPGKPQQWKCKCDCGSVASVSSRNLRHGKSLSCGCTRNQQTADRNRTHGLRHTRIYTIWQKMLARCTRPENHDFKNYGGRGIKVCPEWRDVEVFARDMGTPPESATIDRIDNSGDYKPENCRWASRTEQNRNRRNNRVLSHSGQSMTVAEWAEKVGINYFTLIERLDRGWDVERALTEPVGIQAKGVRK